MINSQNYITNDAALKEAVALIHEEKLVALDTEFMREKTYYPILSLIQIAVKKSGEQKLFIVDALSGVDLTPLTSVIFDKKITKILHASLQDLQIFCQKSGIASGGIFDDLADSVIDTQIMANFCGFNFNTGYSNLAENLLQKNIDKTLQRSDWQRRPLSAEQLKYAISDVIFLEEIYEKLLKILQEKNRTKWYQEEIKIFVNKAMSETQDNLFKNFSFKGRSREEVSRIKNLILWRENWVKKLDLPRQHFMRDETLERVAYLRNFDLNLDEKKITEIKKILEQNVEFEERNYVKDEGNFMNDKQKNLYKKAKELVAEIAREENLKEQLLITSQHLKNLVCTKKSIEESLRGWRYELCGERIKKLIAQI